MEEGLVGDAGENEGSSAEGSTDRVMLLKEKGQRAWRDEGQSASIVVEEEMIALSAIYGDDLRILRAWTDGSGAFLAACLREGGREATIWFSLPSGYPREAPDFTTSVGAWTQGAHAGIIEVDVIIGDELLRQNDAGSGFSIYPLVEAARSAMSMQDVPQVVEDWREDGRMAGDLDGEMLQRLPAHEIPQQEAATSLCVLTLHGMTPDVLEKILSWVDVERDVLKAALVSKTFSSCMHSHGVWAKFWEVRWPSEGVDREEHSQGAFRARYAAELRWDFREETRIIVSKLVSGRTAGAHAPAPAPLVKLAWIWQEGSHVAVASGQQVLVVDHASLYNGSLCNGRVSVEEGWGPEQLIQDLDLIGVSRGHESKVTCMESSEDGTVLALGLGNGVVKVWEARAGAARGPTDFGRVDTAQVLKNHKAAVSQVQVCSRHGVVVSGSQDHTLLVSRWSEWSRSGRARNGARRPQGASLLRGHGCAVTALSCAEGMGGLRAASGGANGSIKLWQCERSACLLSVRASSRVTTMKIVDSWGNSGGELLIAGQRNGGILMYDARAGGSKNGLVCSLVRVYSHVRAHYTQDWTLGTLWGQTMFQESGRDLSPLDAPAVQYIELSGNGRRVASMDSHGTLSIFDMAKIGIAANRSVGEVLHPPIAEGGTSGLRNGERYATEHDWQRPLRLQGENGHVFCEPIVRGGCCGMAADARKVVACGVEDGRICAVDLKGEKVLRVLPEAMPVACGRWLSQATGTASSMLWHSGIRRDSVLVGTSQGFLAAMQLPLVH